MNENQIIREIAILKGAIPYDRLYGIVWRYICNKIIIERNTFFSRNEIILVHQESRNIRKKIRNSKSRVDVEEELSKIDFSELDAKNFSHGEIQAAYECIETIIKRIEKIQDVYSISSLLATGLEFLVDGKLFRFEKESPKEPLSFKEPKLHIKHVKKFVFLKSNETATWFREDNLRVLSGELNSREHFFIMWKRGERISMRCIEEPKIWSPTGHKTIYEPLRSDKENNYWLIKFSPALKEGEEIIYRQLLCFERPFPMTYEEILECGDYYKGFEFAYDGLFVDTDMDFMHYEIIFPNNYNIWDINILVEEQFTGEENKQLRENILSLNCFKEKHFLRNNKWKLTLKIENPTPQITYSATWKPPHEADWPLSLREGE